MERRDNTDWKTCGEPSRSESEDGAWIGTRTSSHTEHRICLADCSDNNTQHSFDTRKVLLICSWCLKKILQNVPFKKFRYLCSFMFKGKNSALTKLFCTWNEEGNSLFLHGIVVLTGNNCALFHKFKKFGW